MILRRSYGYARVNHCAHRLSPGSKYQKYHRKWPPAMTKMAIALAKKVFHRNFQLRYWLESITFSDCNGWLLICCIIPPPTRWTRILVTGRRETPRRLTLLIVFPLLKSPPRRLQPISTAPSCRFIPTSESILRTSLGKLYLHLWANKDWVLYIPMITSFSVKSKPFFMTATGTAQRANSYEQV
jgi:hypothetical protein